MARNRVSGGWGDVGDGEAVPVGDLFLPRDGELGDFFGTPPARLWSRDPPGENKTHAQTMSQKYSGNITKDPPVHRGILQHSL